MSAVRQAFDLSATFVVATESLVCGPESKRYQRGETPPLRELGFTDLDILHLWSAQHIDCESPTAIADPPVAPIVTSTPNQAKQQGRRDKR